MTDIITGDKTYTTRVERYEYIVARRAEKPTPTIQTIANELGISKQNVSRLLSRGQVKPSGRPRSNAGKVQRLQARLNQWQVRRTEKLAKGLDTSYEDNWIVDLEARIKQLA